MGNGHRIVPFGSAVYEKLRLPYRRKIFSFSDVAVYPSRETAGDSVASDADWTDCDPFAMGTVAVATSGMAASVGKKAFAGMDVETIMSAAPTIALTDRSLDNIRRLNGFL